MFNNQDPQDQQQVPNKLYVGNLPWSVTTDQLREMFSEAGEVTDAIVLSDKFTGRSKGFGFVTYATEEEAEKAIEMFNEKEIEGRALVVNKARPKSDKPRFNRDRRGGGYNRGGGNYRKDNDFGNQY